MLIQTCCYVDVLSSLSSQPITTGINRILWECFFFLLSPAKTKTVHEKTPAASHDSTDATENVHERDAANSNYHDETMFNDDDDLDITEIDHVLQGEKMPLSSPKTRKQESKGKLVNSAKTEQKPESQRYVLKCSRVVTLFTVSKIDLFSLYILFSQFTPRDVTLKNRFF